MSKTVLVIDDSVLLHKLIATHLEAERLDLQSAYDGESALAMAIKLRPSLILLDVDMPQLDGFEVCRRLKANPSTTTIPVIFLTGDSMIDDKVKGLDLGAMDYVTKPFKPEELRARVRAALRTKHQLDKRAMLDGLTGLWNLTYLEEHLAAQLSLANRSGRPVACIVANVDHLKTINNKHGMPLGDEVLRSVAQICLSQCRAEDAICHSQGGKFVMLLSGTTRVGAARLADRLRAEVQRQLATRGGIELSVTCSFGVADSLIAGDAALLDRADTALFRAKQNGRNCVFIARQPGDDLRAVA